MKKKRTAEDEFDEMDELSHSSDLSSSGEDKEGIVITTKPSMVKPLIVMADSDLITREEVVKFLQTPSSLKDIQERFRLKIKATPKNKAELVSIMKEVRFFLFFLYCIAFKKKHRKKGGQI
jgi:hypothetical protein